MSAPLDQRARRDASSCARSARPPGSPACVATHGVSPEVDPERWPNARYVLVWGWNPMSTAPHLWRLLLEARRSGARLVVVDPFRSRTARVADEHLRPLPGHRRRARARDDARDRRRRARRRGVVPRPRRPATTSCSSGSASTRSSAAPTMCGVAAEHDRARSAREFATTQPALLRLGVGAQRHMGAPDRLPHDRLPARARRRVAPRRRRLLVHPDGDRRRLSTRAARAAPTCARARSARSTCRSSASALTDPRARPAGRRRWSCWNSNPAAIAPDQDARARGPAPRGPVHRRARAVHDRHRRVTPTSCCRPRRSSSTSTWSSRGATTTSRSTSRRSRRSARRSRTRRSSGCSPRASGSTTRASRETDEEMLEPLLAGAPGRRHARRRCASAAGSKIDLGQGPTPHAEGGFGTPDGKLALRADWLADARHRPAAVLRPAGRGGRRDARARASRSR